MPAGTAPTKPARGAEEDRVLVFGCGGRRLAIGLRHVAGLVEAGSPVPVPLAPDFVVGLLDRRGSVLSVLDLPRLLGHEGGPAAPFVVRLAAPWDHVALRVAEPVRLVPPADRDGAEILDPSALLALAQSALPAGRI